MPNWADTFENDLSHIAKKLVSDLRASVRERDGSLKECPTIQDEAYEGLIKQYRGRCQDALRNHKTAHYNLDQQSPTRGRLNALMQYARMATFDREEEASKVEEPPEWFRYSKYIVEYLRAAENDTTNPLMPEGEECPEHWRARFPIALYDPSEGWGFLLWMTIDWLGRDCPDDEILIHPRSIFHYFDEGWKESLRTAQKLAGGIPFCFRLELIDSGLGASILDENSRKFFKRSFPLLKITGPSAGAAVASALQLMKNGYPVASDVLVSGTIDAEGCIGEVDGWEGKIRAAHSSEEIRAVLYAPRIYDPEGHNLELKEVTRVEQSSEEMRGDQPGPFRGNAIPQVPVYYQPDDAVFASAKDALLQRGGSSVRVGVVGMGGLGKSTLAASLAKSDSVRRRYSDGIVWLGLSPDQSPDSVACEFMSALANALPEADRITANQTDYWARSIQLLRFWKNQKAKRAASRPLSQLVIIDNLSRPNGACLQKICDLFAEFSECKILFTSRDREFASPKDVRCVDLEALGPKASRALVASIVDSPVEDLPEAALEAIEQCGGLPIALEILAMSHRSGNSWESLANALRKADLDALDHGHKSFTQTIEASLNLLKADSPEQYDRFLEMTVLPDAPSVADSGIKTLWERNGNLDEQGSNRYLVRFRNLSLLKLEGENPRRIRLHDLMRVYLKRKYTREYGEDGRCDLHEKMVEAYREKCEDGEWHQGPDDGYYFQHIAWHLYVNRDHSTLLSLVESPQFLSVQEQIPPRDLSLPASTVEIAMMSSIDHDDVCAMQRLVMLQAKQFETLARESPIRCLAEDPLLQEDALDRALAIANARHPNAAALCQLGIAFWLSRNEQKGEAERLLEQINLSEVMPPAYAQELISAILGSLDHQLLDSSGFNIADYLTKCSQSGHAIHSLDWLWLYYFRNGQEELAQKVAEVAGEQSFLSKLENAKNHLVKGEVELAKKSILEVKKSELVLNDDEAFSECSEQMPEDADIDEILAYAVQCSRFGISFDMDDLALCYDPVETAFNRYEKIERKFEDPLRDDLDEEDEYFETHLTPVEVEGKIEEALESPDALPKPSSEKISAYESVLYSIAFEQARNSDWTGTLHTAGFFLRRETLEKLVRYLSKTGLGRTHRCISHDGCISWVPAGSSDGVDLGYMGGFDWSSVSYDLYILAKSSMQRAEFEVADTAIAFLKHDTEDYELYEAELTELIDDTARQADTPDCEDSELIDKLRKDAQENFLSGLHSLYTHLERENCFRSFTYMIADADHFSPKRTRETEFGRRIWNDSYYGELANWIHESYNGGRPALLKAILLVLEEVPDWLDELAQNFINSIYKVENVELLIYFFLREQEFHKSSAHIELFPDKANRIKWYGRLAKRQVELGLEIMKSIEAACAIHSNQPDRQSKPHWWPLKSVAQQSIGVIFEYEEQFETEFGRAVEIGEGLAYEGKFDEALAYAERLAGGAGGHKAKALIHKAIVIAMLGNASDLFSLGDFKSASDLLQRSKALVTLFSIHELDLFVLTHKRFFETASKVGEIELAGDLIERNFCESFFRLDGYNAMPRDFKERVAELLPVIAEVECALGKVDDAVSRADQTNVAIRQVEVLCRVASKIQNNTERFVSILEEAHKRAEASRFIREKRDARIEIARTLFELEHIQRSLEILDTCVHDGLMDYYSAVMKLCDCDHCLVKKSLPILLPYWGKTEEAAHAACNLLDHMYSTE